MCRKVKSFFIFALLYLSLSMSGLYAQQSSTEDKQATPLPLPTSSLTNSQLCKLELERQSKLIENLANELTAVSELVVSLERNLKTVRDSSTTSLEEKQKLIESLTKELTEAKKTQELLQGQLTEQKNYSTKLGKQIDGLQVIVSDITKVNDDLKLAAKEDKQTIDNQAREIGVLKIGVVGGVVVGVGVGVAATVIIYNIVHPR